MTVQTLAPVTTKTMPVAGAVAQALQDCDLSSYADQTVELVVVDATRPLDYDATVGLLLERLPASARVTVRVALGLHRPMTEAELYPLIQIAESAPCTTRVVQHDPVNDLMTVGGRSLSRGLVEADRVLCVGVVEPHQYAGFSGGVKGISIGCAGAETIAFMHGLELLTNPNTCLGRIDGNPFQEALWETASRISTVDALMVVPFGKKACVGAFFGDARAVFERAVELARKSLTVGVSAPFEWLYLPVADAKAQSFYQASRAATYVACSAAPAIERGGSLVIDARCPEGMGRGAGERVFEQTIRRGRDELLSELQNPEGVRTKGGAQRAYVLARALERCRIVLVGAKPIEALEAVGVEQFDSLADAQTALSLKDDRGMMISDVFRQVPLVAASDQIA